MLLLRSLVFQFYFFASVAVASFTIFLLWPFPFRARFAIARNWGKSMLWAGRFICGLDYVIEGKEHVPPEPAVIMIKHTTVFETYAQLAIFPPQTWVVKRELQWIPIFGWGLAAMQPIAINRGAGRRAIDQVIEQGRKLLAGGDLDNRFSRRHPDANGPDQEIRCQRRCARQRCAMSNRSCRAQRR